jgi:AraC family transcriptional regulator of adaptative response/methylated-DNA-[protein]-cysteine methyltransferase
MSDYDRIAAAIHFLDAHAETQPDLAAAAAHVGLSPHHFQRVFTRWAGVSPKRFLQFHTLERARRLLAERRSVLDATYAAGLSGPGRLHDLFVSVEAVTPGEFKTGGRGLRVAWGLHETPFGRALVATCERGVCHLAFGEDDALLAAEFGARWPGAERVRSDLETAPVARRIFSPELAAGAPLALVLKGTNFQLKVWEALLRIPPGAVASYEQIAEAVGRPAAVRAVGTAVGQNPVAFVVPCHRVLRKTGALGGYRWGLDRKRAMLGWEAARADDGTAA